MPQEFYRPVHSQNEGIALAHTVYGEPVHASRPENAGAENAAPAWGTHSTAPYKRRAFDNPAKALCATEGCTAFPMTRADGQGHCVGHARKLGYVPNWSPKSKKVVDGDPE